VAQQIHAFLPRPARASGGAATRSFAPTPERGEAAE